MKIGINTIYKMDVKEIDQYPIIKQAGFDCVMLNYFMGDDVSKMYDRAISAGLEVANIHAPIATVNSVWTDSLEGDDYIEIQKERVDFCHSANVPILVLHTTFLENPPPLSDIGIKRHLTLCEYAEKKGVRLAFENVEPYPHLDAVMKIAGDFHGFCWDVGHNTAYAPDVDYMKLYGDRLRTVHIHDNPGGCDKHRIPFDGNTDWNWYCEEIRKSSFKGPLTLELAAANCEEYQKMGFEKLALIACERILKLRDIIVND